MSNNPERPSKKKRNIVPKVGIVSIVALVAITIPVARMRLNAEFTDNSSIQSSSAQLTGEGNPSCDPTISATESQSSGSTSDSASAASSISVHAEVLPDSENCSAYYDTF